MLFFKCKNTSFDKTAATVAATTAHNFSASIKEADWCCRVRSQAHGSMTGIHPSPRMPIMESIFNKHKSIVCLLHPSWTRRPAPNELKLSDDLWTLLLQLLCPPAVTLVLFTPPCHRIYGDLVGGPNNYLSNPAL